MSEPTPEEIARRMHVMALEAQADRAIKAIEGMGKAYLKHGLPEAEFHAELARVQEMLDVTIEAAEGDRVSDGREHEVPDTTALDRLLAVAERRWPNPGEAIESELDQIRNWLYEGVDRSDGAERDDVTDAANTLAYRLGRTRPVIPFPRGEGQPPGNESPGDTGILGLGASPVREAWGEGVRDVDGLLAREDVRRGLAHESKRFCYRAWLAGEGRYKPGRDGRRAPEETLRAMAGVLLDALRRGEAI